MKLNELGILFFQLEKIVSDRPETGARPSAWTGLKGGTSEETNNRALQLLDRLMDRPGVNIEAFKRVADICDGEEGP